MAIHDFVCDECNVTIQDTNTRDVHKCSECGKSMRWDVRVAIRGNYKHPIHSDSLAIHPSQRAEHEQMFPNIEIDKLNRPVFDNFTDHEAYLKKCNLVKHPQRIKSKGKTLKELKSCKLPTPDA